MFKINSNHSIGGIPGEDQGAKVGDKVTYPWFFYPLTKIPIINVYACQHYIVEIGAEY